MRAVRTAGISSRRTGGAPPQPHLHGNGRLSRRGTCTTLPSSSSLLDRIQTVGYDSSFEPTYKAVTFGWLLERTAGEARRHDPRKQLVGNKTTAKRAAQRWSLATMPKAAAPNMASVTSTAQVASNMAANQLARSEARRRTFQDLSRPLNRGPCIFLPKPHCLTQIYTRAHIQGALPLNTRRQYRGST